MTNIKDLWGDLPSAETIRTPYTILKEQASILTEKTNGLLVGEVKFGDVKSSPQFFPGRREVLVDPDSQETRLFVAYLRIKVPSLNNYTYSVLKIQYSLTDLYPVLVTSFAAAEDRECECKSEAEYENALGKILSSSDVKRVISSLLAQVHA
ncbi:MAG: hypothetical protein RID53_22770 [Coleofasciculus sp. B1-GNL1-01]|uniref:hypothetical protein n=1 Tax=Coleofasciculus sp. B1-GNL1-01 TaxID=3068484 RepID=UPI0032F725A7